MRELLGYDDIIPMEDFVKGHYEDSAFDVIELSEDAVRDLGYDIKNGILERLENGINGLIKEQNEFTQQVFELSSDEIYQWEKKQALLIEAVKMRRDVINKLIELDMLQ